MAGGKWSSQNKVLPGVYTNIVAAPNTNATPGNRGIVAIAEVLDWGVYDEIITIQSEDDVYNKLGYPISDSRMTFIREMFRGTDRSDGASTIYVWNLSGGGEDGAKATATVGNLTVTAAYYGVRGNDITIIVTPNINTLYNTTLYAVWTVQTVVDGAVVNSQTIGSYTSGTVHTAATVADLVNNDWVIFSGTGTFTTSTAGTALTGGVTATVTTDYSVAYSIFLAELEAYDFNVLCFDGVNQATAAAAAVAFVERLCNNEGRYCQLVVGAASGLSTSPNSECVILIADMSVYLNDGTIYGSSDLTWWVAGATAGANYNQSLTSAIYPTAVDCTAKTQEYLISAINAGYFVFAAQYGQVIVVKDIDTLTTFTQTKTKPFSKNRVIRVLWTIANTLYYEFSLNYVGKTDNNEYGRNLLKAYIISLCNNMQANNGLQNFDATDVTVEQGTDSDSVVVTLAVTPVDSVEKIYMTIVLQ